MPWHKVKGHKQCPASKPWAVVKDKDGKVVGCHASESRANKQLAALHVSEEKRMSEPNGVLTKIRGLIDKYFDQEVDREIGSSVVRRQDDGSYRMISVSAADVLNRVGEIDSREMFDRFIEMNRAAGHNPKRDFMHLGKLSDAFITGEIDFMTRIGHLLITSTLYNDSELAKAEIKARQKDPDYWGDSIAYSVLDFPDVEDIDEKLVAIFRQGHLNFVSTVPEVVAASEFTGGSITEVRRMNWKELDEVAKNAFVSVLGDGAEEWYDSKIKTKNDEIDEEELVSRSIQESAEAEAEPETEAEPVEEIVDVELDDEMVIDLVGRVAEHESFAAQFSQISEQIEAIGAQMAELVQSAQAESDEVQRRLESLERDEEELVAEIAADMPRKTTLRVSHRPRDAYKEDGGTVDYQSQADSVLAGLDSGMPK
jgi:hypothetical protein